MGKFLSALLDFIFPPRCIYCRAFLTGRERYHCSKCAENLPYTDGVRIYGESFDYAVAPLFYRDNVRNAIHRFKFSGMAGYARGFGKIVADCIKNEVADYDIITWVPVSKERKKARGYDQSMLMAQAAALELDTVAVETLFKQVHTVAQSTISDHEERRKNVTGAYVVIDPELIQNKRVLLIDDIVTSCSTLNSCASVLLQAGAESVVCVTLANASGTENAK